jgi:hypothetical protein
MGMMHSAMLLAMMAAGATRVFVVFVSDVNFDDKAPLLTPAPTRAGVLGPAKDSIGD